MKLEAIHVRPGKLPVYRAVFNEQTPDGGTRMLRFSADGYRISRWVSAPYDVDGQNEHLGERTTLAALGARALDGFFSRLGIPDEWEEAYQTIEQIIREGE